MKTLIPSLYKVMVMLTPILAATTVAANEEMKTGPAQLVDALNGTFGKHDGARASHAKGFCAKGEFTPDKNIGELVSNKLFMNGTIPAKLRFSIGGGNPAVSDKSRSVRGMSIRLSNAAETYDLVLISEPAFFAATPESFVSFLNARVPDPATKKPDPQKIAAHNARFPEGTIQPLLLVSHAAPASYAATSYFSTNAFGFRNQKQQLTWARIQAEPKEGTQYLSAEQEKNMPDLFLEDELKNRLAQKPFEFTIYAQLPDKGDSLVDPSQVWTGKKRIAIGKLVAISLAPKDDCDANVFLPLQLPQNIEGSDDPILKARAAAYAVSLSRRAR